MNENADENSESAVSDVQTIRKFFGRKRSPDFFLVCTSPGFSVDSRTLDLIHTILPGHTLCRIFHGG